MEYKKTFSVGELIEKLEKIKNKKLPVFMLTDRSDRNYNEDGIPIACHPIDVYMWRRDT